MPAPNPMRLIMNPGLYVGSPFGVPLRVHPLTPAVGALLAWGYAGILAPHMSRDTPSWVPVALGVSCYGLFVASLLAHEYGHVLTARRFGLGTRHVSLTPFGCVAALDDEPRNAREEFSVALAGPAVSIALALVGLSLSRNMPAGIPALVAFVTGVLNAGIAAFNLIPCFPTDGGRLVRSVAWGWTGDRYRATRTARNVGWFGAAAMVAFGGYVAAHGNPLGLLAVAVAVPLTVYATREVGRLAPTGAAPVPPGPVARDAMLPFGERTDGLGVYLLPGRGGDGSAATDLVATMAGRHVGRWPTSIFPTVGPDRPAAEAFAAAAAGNPSGVPVAIVVDGAPLGYVAGTA